jgi:hypothetical protein
VRCIGMNISGPGLIAQPADCNDGTINEGRRFKRGASPDALAPNPTVDFQSRSLLPTVEGMLTTLAGDKHSVTGHVRGTVAFLGSADMSVTAIGGSFFWC